MFKHLNITDQLIQSLKNMYITSPTPVQAKSIPAIFEGYDIMAEAETGTGKTLAFLLPIMQNLKGDHTQALILSPTRELAIQIADEARKLDDNIRVLSVFGGQDIGSQLKKLNRGIQVIVATPGRLMDHIKRDHLDLSKLNYLVLDEVDQLLDMGFRDDLYFINSQCNQDKQVIGFSATIAPSVKKLAYKIMDNPHFISVKERAIPKDIKQYIIETNPRQKLNDLSLLFDRFNPFMAIVFCRTRRRVDELEVKLHQKNYNVMKLHGGMPQSKRQKSIKAFKALKVQYLVATEVAARGLDITGVTHVFNYDMPETVESYIHRIGRTGRNDSGETYLFKNPEDQTMLEAIENQLGYSIKVIHLDDL